MRIKLWDIPFYAKFSVLFVVLGIGASLKSHKHHTTTEQNLNLLHYEHKSDLDNNNQKNNESENIFLDAEPTYKG